MSAALPQPPVETVAHIVQLALTPVFLLSGIAALLNVFSSRLARVADQVAAVRDKLETCRPEADAHLKLRLTALSRRSKLLDAAVAMGAVGGVCTGVAVLALFIGAVGDISSGRLLLASFGMAVVCTVGALIAYLAESLLASRGVRREVERSGG